MTLSIVPAANYFVLNGKVYYKGVSGRLFECLPTDKMFVSINGDPEVEVVSGEQAYKLIKKVEPRL